MTKREFFDLLKKYESEQFSKSETDLLFKFCDEAQKKDFQDYWNLAEKGEARVRLFGRIMATVKASNVVGPSKSKYRRAWLVAAIFLGLVLAGYLNQQISSLVGLPVLPKNEIIFEFNDGTCKILENEGTTKVLDKNGEIVGLQEGNKLVYKNTTPSKELAYHARLISYGKQFRPHLSDSIKVQRHNVGSSLKYPTQFLDREKRKVFVTGEAFLEATEDTAYPFIINADKLNVRFLGACFSVYAYTENKLSEIVLV